MNYTQNNQEHLDSIRLKFGTRLQESLDCFQQNLMLVKEKLQEKAASMGADAVVMVQYGEVGMSLMSYGKIDGRGKAIKFVD